MFNFLYRNKNGKNDKYIYIIANDEIFVMKLIPKDYDIIKYKQNILSQYSPEQLFRYLETDNIETMLNFCNTNYSSYLNYSSGSWETHRYGSFGYTCQKKLDDEQIGLLHNYINGKYKKILTYKENDGNILYLINTDENCLEVRGKTDHFNHPIFRSYNIINLPKKLYLLQLLCECRYDLLVDEDISEQLALFDFEYVTSFRLEDYKKLICEGYVDNNESAAVKKVNDSNLVYRKSKKM